jgi:hypothetical protein
MRFQNNLPQRRTLLSLCKPVVRWLLTLCLLWSAIPTAASAQDEDQAHAKERFERGVTEYEAGQFTEALADFQEAYRLKPHPLVRVNMANCYDKLDRPVEAIFHFELFMSSQQGKPEQREEVKEALKSLRKRIGKLLLSVAPDGARVAIDAVDERRAPIMEPMVLKAGPHEIVVSLDGYDTLKRSVDVKPENSTELTLRLTRPDALAAAAVPAPVAAAPEAAQAPDSQPLAQSDQRAAPQPEPALAAASAADTAPPARGRIPASVWIAGGLTVALAVTGTVTGLLARSAEQNFNDNLHARFDPLLTSAQQQIAWQQANDASTRAKGLALTTDVLFGGAIIGAALTLYFYLSRPHADAQTALGPSLIVNGGTTAVRAHF